MHSEKRNQGSAVSVLAICPLQHFGQRLSARVLRKGSLGRATGLLIRSVKSNKELLLARVTEPGEYAGARLGGKEQKRKEKCLWEKQYPL